MYFQIKKVILWPKRGSFAPRELQFEVGKVNVISGASRTGKSAVIPIIDYCLGAGKCSIPVNTIRDACSWFGLLIETGSGQFIIARPSPEGQKITNEFFLKEGNPVEIPHRIEKNTNAEAAKDFLDNLSGLTRLSFDEDLNNVGFKGRPSFRDMAAFTFQPQNVVANPDVLFFKADSYEHKEKLKTIFPYVLGAVTPEVLAKQFELAQLEKKLKQKDSEIRKIREISQQWLSEVDSAVAQARELGLLGESQFDDGSWQTRVGLLRGVVERTDYQYQITSQTITSAVHKLAALQAREAEIGTSVAVLRNRLAEMEKLRGAAAGYGQKLMVQRDRLQISDWLEQRAAEASECPTCGTDYEDALPQDTLARLVGALRAVESNIGVFKVAPAAIDREQQQANLDLQEELEKLKGVQLEIRNLQLTSKDASQARYNVRTR